MSTADLSAWFKERPKWIQRAAKELLEKDHLTDNDIIDLAELCRKEAVGNAGEFEYAFPVEAFTSNTSDAVRLCSIGDVQDINALAPRIPLDFGESNLAIIYGPNGSGKSGYVRILKHVCGARYQGTLHPNFYSSVSSIQQCSISYEINGSATSRKWQANSGVIDDLCGLDIFDSSCGQVYIANENEVSYEPPVLSFFSSLISVCGKVSQLLDAEAAKLVSQKPALPSDYVDTVAGKWYANLSKDLTINDIAKYCSWTNEDKKELEQLDKRLSEQSPADKAKQLRAQKQHTDTLIQNTEDLLKKLSDENCRRILTAKKQSLLKLNASKAAAEQVFIDAPLDGIGSDVWKLLWEQARKYSQEQAYEEKVFPCIEEDSRCVLCQQPLSKDARRRIQSFEDFVKGEIQKEAEAAKKQFDDAIGDVGEMPSEEAVETKVDAAGLANDQDDLKGFYAALRNRKDKLLAKVDSVEEVDATALGITVLPECKEWIEKSRDISSGYDELAQKYEKDDFHWSAEGCRQSLEGR